jgi:hypothetical protein
MADNASGAAFSDDDAHLDLKPILRLGAWGAGAFAALAFAVVVGQSDSAGRRVGTALASLTGSTNEQAAHASGTEMLVRADAEREAKRLAEAVRVLAADRDRLAGRLAALERNLDDLTGSVARVAARPAAEPAKVVPAEPAPAVSPPPTTLPPASATATPTPAKPAAPPPAVAAPSAGAAAHPSAFQTSSLMAPATPMWRDMATLPAIAPKESMDAPEPKELEPVPLPRPGPVAMLQSYAGAGATASLAPSPPANGASPPRLQFAIDLGAAPTLAGVRALWNRVKVRQPATFEALQPLVNVRDGVKPGSTELRLVAGPLADATSVARLCAVLIPAGISCQPAVFDGQRLAER